MKILMSPQVRENNKIWYEIENQKITATINGVSDTFDFTGMPNGELQLYNSDGESMTESTLDEAPILGAKKENGVLTVEILFSIDSNEQDKRLLFPKPMELDEFNDLMKELAERKNQFKEQERGSRPTTERAPHSDYRVEPKEIEWWGDF